MGENPPIRRRRSRLFDTIKSRCEFRSEVSMLGNPLCHQTLTIMPGRDCLRLSYQSASSDRRHSVKNWQVSRAAKAFPGGRLDAGFHLLSRHGLPCTAPPQQAEIDRLDSKPVGRRLNRADAGVAQALSQAAVGQQNLERGDLGKGFERRCRSASLDNSGRSRCAQQGTRNRLMSSGLTKSRPATSAPAREESARKRKGGNGKSC